MVAWAMCESCTRHIGQPCAEWHKSILTALVNSEKNQKNKTVKTTFVPVYLVAVAEHPLHLHSNIDEQQHNNTMWSRTCNLQFP